MNCTARTTIKACKNVSILVLYAIQNCGPLNDQASKFRLGCPLFQHKCRQRTRPRLLREVGAADRKTIGEDIKTVQIGWPLGMPLVRKMGKDMWEVRIPTYTGVSPVFCSPSSATRWFCCTSSSRSLRKRRKKIWTSRKTVCARLGKVKSHTQWSAEIMANKHIGGSCDEFLTDEAILEEVTATAMKRVIAWQIAEEMKAQKITKTAMAARMNTSRAALNRLLDDTDTSLTLTTLASAAAALGKHFRLELAA